MNTIRSITQEKSVAKRKVPSTRRGADGRRKRLQTIRGTKICAIALRRYAAAYHMSRADVAAWLGVSERTLRGWEYGWAKDRLDIKPRGRPQKRAGREERNLVIALLRLMGPSLGVEPIHAIFHWMARREIEDIVRRYRAVYRKQNELVVDEITWLSPGTVWAVDFSTPDGRREIDGEWRKIIAVRDLATGEQLAWDPVSGETAEAAIAEMHRLFRMHGPPLVLKNDNGSAFIAKEFQGFLEEWNVINLLSPPCMPKYNGAVEAGNGSMKKRTRASAARNGRVGDWTCDDLEAARQQANETARPNGANNPTPDEAWAERSRITDDQRNRFLEEVREQRKRATREENLLFEYDDLEKLQARASIDRIAIPRAMVERGILKVRRKRISPRLKSGKVTFIS